MTYHSLNKKWDYRKDKVTDEIIDEIVQGVLYGPPIAYYVGCQIDAFILIAGQKFYNGTEPNFDNYTLKEKETLKKIFDTVIVKLNESKKNER